MKYTTGKMVLYTSVGWPKIDEGASTFVCEYCRSQSATGAVRCTSCGAPRTIPVTQSRKEYEMKTMEEVLAAIKGGRESACLDGRDYLRLAAFVPDDQLEVLGFVTKMDDGAREVLPWTETAILTQLAKDVDFGFEKALDQRGLSADIMYQVVKMWMWVLNDPLADFTQYAQYGLPLFKAVALKYNLPNLIGSDAGTERKYSY